MSELIRLKFISVGLMLPGSFGAQNSPQASARGALSNQPDGLPSGLNAASYFPETLAPNSPSRTRTRSASPTATWDGERTMRPSAARRTMA